MEYGKALRFHRVKQGLTQNQLADGIISAAYLSKIENDQTVPAIEVLELLYERLGIDFNESNFNHPSKEKLREWYEAIVFKQKDVARRLRDELHQQKNTLDNHQLYIFYELFRIRYLLLENEVEKAYETWEDLKQHKDTFDEEMEFYFHLISGLVKYYKGDFNDAFQELMEAKNYSFTVEIEKWETSDLYYLLALSTSQANHISASNYYADHALEIYQSHYDLSKSADCHIVLGINFSRLKNYAKSLENYHLARKIALQTNDFQQLKLVYINIGVLESRLDNHQAAITNYKKSLEYSGDSDSSPNSFELLNSIHGLITEHYKLGDWDGCKQWVSKGKACLDEHPSKTHQLHFEFYDKLLNDTPDIQDFLEHEVIPYFQERKNHTYIIRYSMFLADQLETQRMYKKSSTYLRLAIQLLNKHSHLGGILL
ncbi:transcriptional regulator [Halobacillus andaensis]|uniref:Transcriptional regulator n=1 Tax=Halobacillus andaensis TaxID=1176239 RepID=A0A917EW62_HALAA|nr:helix-turn-helix transcriptional regulator [Halobacillus andaensis]MBP2004564.1 transcriptional regulator with XRE-family HTH domain [Halobacillus andaensis]GGF20701.1 transcriptional regulator [Halobacillus andaensis]